MLRNMADYNSLILYTLTPTVPLSLGACVFDSSTDNKQRAWDLLPAWISQYRMISDDEPMVSLS